MQVRHNHFKLNFIRCPFKPLSIFFCWRVGVCESVPWRLDCAISGIAAVFHPRYSPKLHSLTWTQLIYILQIIYFWVNIVVLGFTWTCFRKMMHTRFSLKLMVLMMLTYFTLSRSPLAYFPEYGSYCLCYSQNLFHIRPGSGLNVWLNW